MSDKRIMKRIAAVTAAAAMTLGLAGCGEDTMYSASSGGTQIPAGVYIYFLMNKYYEAQSHMTENDTDVFAITIDDKNANDWIVDGAKERLREYAAVEQKFTEYGLSLSDEEISSLKLNLDQLWDYYGESYETLGIAESSFLLVYENNMKADKLFDAVYGENGSDPVSEDAVKSYYLEQYALINYIDMHLVDGDENLLKSDGKAERMEMAKGYVERIKNGEDFDAVAEEYFNFTQTLVPSLNGGISAGDEADGSAAAETAAETEASTAETTSSDAADETAAPAETAPTQETEAEADVTEAPSGEDTVQTASAEPSDANEGGEEEEAGNLWADDVPAEEDDFSDSIDISDPYGVYGDASAAQFYSNRKFIKRDSAVPDENVDNKVFDEMSVGDVIIIEEDEHYYIVAKYDPFEDPSNFESAKESLLHEMKDEDYEKLSKEWAGNVDVNFNDKAVKRYSAKKFAETE